MISVVVFIIFSMETCLALNICPTAVWRKDAITVAGIQSGTAGSSLSRLDWPSDIFIDNNNTIYVLDFNNNRVQRVIQNSSIRTTVVNSSYGTRFDQFIAMSAMSIDANGNIYILDYGNARVMKWKQGGSSGTLAVGSYGAGSNDNQINWPSGMFMEQNTLVIWIADTGNHRIVKWSSPTTSLVVCGSYGSNDNQFDNPMGLFVDTNNSNILYVADTNNHRIQMWLPGATYGITVAGRTGNYGTGLNQLWYPLTLMVDNNQNMFIVDSTNQRILKWMIGSTSGIIIAGDTTSGIQPNQVYYPSNINFDSGGSLYVADRYNNRVQKFIIACPVTNMFATTPASITTAISTTNATCSMTTWSSDATTIAGSPIGVFGNTPTSLFEPYDVFIDENNTLYVTDSHNNRVQHFYSNSTVGTTLGNGQVDSIMSQLYFVRGISADSNGNIYIVDGGNHRVIKWIPGAIDGVIVAGGHDSGVNANQLNTPYGIFVESNTSFMWIADTFNNRIVRWESSSTGIVVCGSYGSQPYQFNYPYAIFIDESASKTLYVADTYNHRIQMWLSGATSGMTIAGQTGVRGNGLDQLSYPSSIILDKNKNIYISDLGNNRIIQWQIGSTLGMIIAGTSMYGTQSNQLFSPRTIKLDSSGALIVTDTNNNRVQKFSVSCIGATRSFPSTFVNPLLPSTATIVLNSSMIATSTQMLTTTYSNLSTVLNVMLTTTTIANRVSFACIDGCSQWLLIILCSILTLIDN